jgi:hypothetical protein
MKMQTSLRTSDEATGEPLLVVALERTSDDGIHPFLTLARFPMADRARAEGYARMQAGLQGTKLVIDVTPHQGR